MYVEFLDFRLVNFSRYLSPDLGPELDVGGSPAHLAGGIPVAQHSAGRRSRRDCAVPARRIHGALVSIIMD